MWRPRAQVPLIAGGSIDRVAFLPCRDDNVGVTGVAFTVPDLFRLYRRLSLTRVPDFSYKLHSKQPCFRYLLLFGTRRMLAGNT